MNLNEVFIIFGALAGVALLVPALVNALKYFGAINDGQSGKAQTLINLVLFVSLAGVKLFVPDFDPSHADQVLGQLAGVITGIIALVGQFGISKKAYESIWKGRAGILGTNFDDSNKELIDNLDTLSSLGVDFCYPPNRC